MQTKKVELLEELRAMLKDVFTVSASGAAYARVARAHGYVDGFMRALLDTGTVCKSDLLMLVAEEREKLAGPATRSTLHLDDPMFQAPLPAKEAAA